MWTYRVEVRPCAAGDVRRLAALGIRESDGRESIKTCGLLADEALRRSAAASHLAAAIFTDGNIVALLGVGSALHNFTVVGIPWLVAHEDFARRETAAVMGRICRRFCDCWFRAFGRLMNVADPDNEASMRFLQRMGFSVMRNSRYTGPGGDSLAVFWRI